MANRRSKKFDVTDALDFVMNGADSEISDLSSDEEDETNSDAYNPQEEEHCESAQGTDGSDNESDEENVASEMKDMDAPTAHSSASHHQKSHVFRWRRKDIPQAQMQFHGDDDVRELGGEMTPLDYFKLFWTDALTNIVVENTNLYSFQKKGKSINTCKEEIERYLGMHMKMGIINLPLYLLYWSNEMRYPAVADVMPLKRFQSVRRFLHFVDNDLQHESDKLFKVRPIIEGVQQQCTLIKPEETHSVDEQIIPSKTKFSKIRQYNPRKPSKWGFKNLVRAGASGFMYDFFVYGGKENTDVNNDDDISKLQKSAQVVAKLCKNLPPNANHKVYFDNWFTTLDLLLYLKRRGILACGTIRKNRLQGCPLASDKEMKKEGRGSVDFKCDMNSGLIVSKWYDNSSVHLASNFVGVEPMMQVSRWCSKEKAKVAVQCPKIVMCYNGGMFGVDLADMLISLYRITVKTKRWYVKIFWHCVDIAKVNAWLLYRRHCKQQGIPAKRQLPLLNFVLQLSDTLTAKKETPVMQRLPGRPPKRRSLEMDETPKAGRKPFSPAPGFMTKKDQTGHWPEIRSKQKGRCRHCPSGYSRTFCKKCDVCLCLTGQRNCFFDFHQ